MKPMKPMKLMKPMKTTMVAPVKEISWKFNEKLPKKIFKQTKIKNLPATNRTFLA